MRNFKLIGYFVLIFSLFAISTYGQNNLFVKTKHAVEKAIDLKEIRKIVFESGEIVVVGDADKQAYLLLNTRYLSFSPELISSITPNEIPENVHIFPNPVTNEISVESNEPVSKLLLYDLNGRLIKQDLFMSPTIKWDISDLPSGNYILQIVTAQSSNSRKIIKK